jgi:hypothetical protein
VFPCAGQRTKPIIRQQKPGLDVLPAVSGEVYIVSIDQFQAIICGFKSRVDAVLPRRLDFLPAGIEIGRLMPR